MAVRLARRSLGEGGWTPSLDLEYHALSAREARRRCGGGQRPSSCFTLFLVLRCGNYGQVITGQFPGAGSSIRLGAPAGTIWTTTVTALTLPSLRIRCTSPQPMSVKLWPAV